MPTIPAISLWQPYASFIAIGAKPYETRHWVAPRRFIGQRIAIHAAKRRMSKDDLEWWSMVSGQSLVPPVGAFVCTAVLAAILPAVRVPPDDYGDYSEGRFAWHLTDIEPIEPAIPGRGAQGFWMWERP
jgi:hypothetical protein